MSEVIERDFGWNKLMDKLKRANSKPGVKVGVLSDAGEHDSSGEDLILIAAANELGTDTIPSRPFIRGAYDEHQKDLLKTQGRLWNLVMQDKLTIDGALGLLGESHQAQIQQYMAALSTPPNAPRTIAQKGSSNPLIDEGILRRSIRWELDK